MVGESSSFVDCWLATLISYNPTQCNCTTCVTLLLAESEQIIHYLFPENCLAGLAGPAHWHQGQQRHSAQCKTAGGVPRGKASPRCHVGMQLCYMEFLLGLRETVQGGPLLTTEPFGMLCGGFLVRHARKGNSCKFLAL